MDRQSITKVVNQAKAKLAERQGPARAEQDAAPIGDAIRASWERDMLSFSSAAGGFVEGATDQSLEKIRVVDDAG